MRRYRSYRLDRSRRPVTPTPARRRQDWQNSAAHYGLAFRVAMALGFLFALRVAYADAQAGEVVSAAWFGLLAAACGLAALFLRIES